MKEDTQWWEIKCDTSQGDVDDGQNKVGGNTVWFSIRWLGRLPWRASYELRWVGEWPISSLEGFFLHLILAKRLRRDGGFLFYVTIKCYIFLVENWENVLCVSFTSRRKKQRLLWKYYGESEIISWKICHVWTCHPEIFILSGLLCIHTCMHMCWSAPSQ